MKKPGRRVQYAALPFRRGAGGVPQVMLVTSRRSKRWIIPKGWPMKRKTASAAAAREALEEAGVTGQIGRKPLGSYSYRKRLKDGGTVLCKVKVFPLKVRGQRKSWPEEGKRQVRWFSPARAAQLVSEPLLKAIIREMPASVPKGRVGALRKKLRRTGSRPLAERPAAKRAAARGGQPRPRTAARSATARRATSRRAMASAAKAVRVRSKRR